MIDVHRGSSASHSATGYPSSSSARSLMYRKRQVAASHSQTIALSPATIACKRAAPASAVACADCASAAARRADTASNRSVMSRMLPRTRALPSDGSPSRVISQATVLPSARR